MELLYRDELRNNPVVIGGGGNQPKTVLDCSSQAEQWGVTVGLQRFDRWLVQNDLPLHMGSLNDVNVQRFQGDLLEREIDDRAVARQILQESRASSMMWLAADQVIYGDIGIDVQPIR